jgi:hypothetical protein
MYKLYKLYANILYSSAGEEISPFCLSHVVSYTGQYFHICITQVMAEQDLTLQRLYY